MKSLTEIFWSAQRLSSTILAAAFFSLSIVVLLLYSGLDIFHDVKVRQAAIFSMQQLTAQDAARTVSSFINENFNILEASVWTANPHAHQRSEQRQILQSLLGLRSGMRQLVLLNARSQILAQASRLSMQKSKEFTDRIKSAMPERYPQIKTKKEISPVYIDPVTSEPLVTMTVPVTDVSGDFKGTVIAELNLKFMWDIVDQLKVGQTGYVYVTDRMGNLLALHDTARVLKGENVSHSKAVADFIQNPPSVLPSTVRRYRGIMGSTVVGTFTALKTPDWAVVTELPWEEAYREIIWDVARAVGVTLAMATLAGMFGLYVARRLAIPVINLTETASRIAGGERHLRAAEAGPREIAQLAVAFNSMTAQLQESLQDLKQRFDDLKRTEEAYRLSEERLRLVLEGTSDGFWDWNVATGQAYFSSRYYTMLGYAPDEFPATYDSWRSLIHPEDITATEERLRQHFEEKLPTFNVEIRLKTRNGDYRWILTRGKVVERDAEGMVIRMSGTHSDITERKQADEALRREKHFSDTIIDGMPGIFYVFDEQGRFIRWNKRLESTTGYDAEEISRMHPADFFVGVEKDYIAQKFQQVLSNGEIEAEANLTTKEGRTIPHYFTGIRIRINSRAHVFGVGLDISDRKLAESQSARLQALLKSVVLQSPVPMALALPDGTVELFNDSCRTVLGVEEELHLQPGLNLFTLEPSWKDYDAQGAYVPLTESPLAKALQGKTTRGREMKVVHKNGSERWILVDAVSVHGENSEVVAGFLIFLDITARKRAEIALLESEQRFRAVVENAQAIISIVDENGIIQLSEGQGLGRLGRVAGQTVGRSAFELYRDAPGVMEGLKRALDGHTNRTTDVFGEVVLETVYSPYFTPDGRKNGVISIALDITERTRAEAAVKEHQEKLAVALQGADLGSWNWNVQSGELSFDERWAGMLGYRVDEIEPHVQSWEALVHPDDLPRALEALTDHLEGRTPIYETEHRLRHKSGSWIWVLDRGKVIDRDAAGRPIRAAGTHLNISERKRAEEALEKRIVALTQPLDDADSINFEVLFNLDDIQRLQDEFANATGVASLITRTDGTPITRPSNFCQFCTDIIQGTDKGLANCRKSDAMLGLLSAQGPVIRPCLGAGLWDACTIISVGGKHIANWGIGQVRNETQNEEEIMAYARELGADEEAFRVAYRKVPVMSQEQFEKVAHVLFELAKQISTTAYQNVQQARFITERKRAEEALRKYERIVSTSMDLMALINRDYTYEAVNESMLKAFDKPRKEVVGRAVPECIGARVFQEKIRPWLDQALSGQTVHFQETLDLAGLGRRILDIRYFPLFDETGEAGGVVLNARDITDRRRLEEQLLQSQKIESIGTLAGGVAHEINNPINGIMNYAQLILDGTEADSPAKEYAHEIVNETQRIAKIVRNLLTFARDEKQFHSPALISDIVSSVLSLIQTVMRRDQIDLHLEIPDNLPKIKCRSQQIQQVLMNLMTNARDALNERYSGYSKEKRMRVFAELIEKQGRSFIRTTVEDSGKGIPPELLDRIFDPFFTTKPKEIGTGLGLSISYGIVKEHGGELSVESEPAGYTRFHMDLPVDNGWSLSAS